MNVGGATGRVSGRGALKCVLVVLGVEVRGKWVGTHFPVARRRSMLSRLSIR